jgi:hypothetical protein
MASGWTWNPDEPWRVTFAPPDDERIVWLHTGDFTATLPALEAHKLGSALHAASGLDTSSTDDLLADIFRGERPKSTEGAPHESDGGGRISSRGAPDPPNGGPAPPSTPAPQPDARFVPPSCPACGIPCELVRKFNNGDPIEFYQETCSCEETAVYGWGVWHSEDKAWVGFGATNGVAAELIPEGPGYGHLWLRPGVAHIVADVQEDSEGNEDYG